MKTVKQEYQRSLKYIMADEAVAKTSILGLWSNKVDVI